MLSELPPMIPSFLVLNIPMNLLQSRKRVRQRAPRFREFHLHSTKRNSSSLAGARWDIRFLKRFGEIFQDNLQRREENLNKRCHSKDGVAFFVLEISSLHNAASPAIPTDSCEASVVRSTLPLMFCVCLSQ